MLNSQRYEYYTKKTTFFNTKIFYSFFNHIFTEREGRERDNLRSTAVQKKIMKNNGIKMPIPNKNSISGPVS